MFGLHAPTLTGGEGFWELEFVVGVISLGLSSGNVRDGVGGGWGRGGELVVTVIEAKVTVGREPCSGHLRYVRRVVLGKSNHK